ncbi:Ubiquinone biosynthesis O-methyltransferase [Maioricimonas rarisocia]|uniref:Ubiquinone biosynthesis O-methyltransferase n=1 Tax=Maioricimonas rarisocia TaxID=2528026 RepID=A0A517Z0U0_9PLAN|nr:class I SAM-dependent methyltransferase [Maioricimonas rarisocia]QDU36097.1 Ubiquinone biosynthesis O-methyltransferase [Maioricimonas rarisocia]
MPANHQPVPCDLCGNRKPTPFLEATDQKTGDPEHRLYLARCERCELVYLSPRPDPDVAESYFRAVYTGEKTGGRFTTYYHDEEIIRAKNEARLDWCLRDFDTAPQNLKVLDVGAGRGHFVKVAADRGCKAVGVELDQAACDYGRGHYDVEMICATLETSQLTPESFDVVTMWDLIEHVESPTSVVQQAVRLLKPGGKLVVRTGNVDSWVFARSPQQWDMLFSGHTYYFSPTTLGGILEKCGLEGFHVVNAKKIDPVAPRNGKPKKQTRSLTERIAALLRDPRRLMNLPHSISDEVRFYRFKRRFPSTWSTSIMLAEARTPARSVSAAGIEQSATSEN